MRLIVKKQTPNVREEQSCEQREHDRSFVVRRFDCSCEERERRNAEAESNDAENTHVHPYHSHTPTRKAVRPVQYNSAEHKRSGKAEHRRTERNAAENILR